MQGPGHINANPVFHSYSCLNVYMYKQSMTKKIGHNYTKKTVLICSKVTTIAMIALSPSFFLCNQFAILQHNSNIAFQK